MAKQTQINAPEPWRESIKQYLSYLRAAGQSDDTRSTRRCQLSKLARDLGGDPMTVSAAELLRWYADQDWREETRKSARAAVRKYFEWLQTHQGRTDNPADGLPSIRPPKPHPRPCPEEYIAAAKARANDIDRLMIRLMAEVGLRRQEVCRIHSNDIIDPPASSDGIEHMPRLVVHGKGSKQRILPIPLDIAERIKESNGYLFPGRFGGHASSSYIGKHVSRLLPDGWSGHKLRTRWATRGYEATHDIYLVSAGLGHASIETTMAYVPMPDSRLEELIEAAR
ncbi:integrase [Bifidobacterium callimiconis]|uniref:Integrase n=2 Tax=Bifidobacterium callimiconis TaxID=2306973 RepID=A0A430FBR9_9BIFI|nr:integrase [Bifidobacterium callimiconis]